MAVPAGIPQAIPISGQLATELEHSRIKRFRQAMLGYDVEQTGGPW